MKFNQEYARKVSKAEFIENHKHWEDKTDLGREWEDLQEKPEAEEETIKKKVEEQAEGE